MRPLLGALSLLVALAVVFVLVRTQLGVAPAARAVAASGPAPDAPASLRQAPRRVADDIARALDQGAQRRAEDADR